MKIKKLEDNFEYTTSRTGNNSSTTPFTMNNSWHAAGSHTSNASDTASYVTIIDEDDNYINQNNNNNQQSVKIRLADDDEIIFHNIRAKDKSEKKLLSSSLETQRGGDEALPKFEPKPQSTSQQQLAASPDNSKNSNNNDDNMAIPLIIKSPEFTVINGNARFDRLHDPDRFWETISFPPVEVSGQNIGLKLNYVDYSHEPYRKVGTKTGYITFFNWIDDGVESQDNMKFTYEGIREAQGIQIPADISESAMSQEIGVPWEKAITSLNSLILLIAVVFGALITVAVYRMRGKRE